jgi:uncharacterized BrkB/YihY/UPF0761 family membrane protein
MKSRWDVTFFTLLALAPALSFAATSAITVRQDVWNPTILAGPLTVCTGNYLVGGNTTNTGGLPTCTDLCDLFGQIIAILYYLMAVGIWIIVPIMFLWSGVSLMISRGDPGKTSEARKMLTGAVIGVAIMLGAYLIVSTFIGFLKIAHVGGFGGDAACVVLK